MAFLHWKGRGKEKISQPRSCGVYGLVAFAILEPRGKESRGKDLETMISLFPVRLAEMPRLRLQLVSPDEYLND